MKTVDFVIKYIPGLESMSNKKTECLLLTGVDIVGIRTDSIDIVRVDDVAEVDLCEQIKAFYEQYVGRVVSIRRVNIIDSLLIKLKFLIERKLW